MSQVDVEFTFMGTKELRRKIKAMPVALRKRITRKAAMAGANVIREQAKANVKAKFTKYATGTLATNIGTQVKVKNVLNVGEVAINIGPTKHAWWGRLLETGWENVAAKPWLRPAFDAKVNAAVRKCSEIFFNFFNKV